MTEETRNVPKTDETCPQCLNTMSGHASRLVQDSCGHKKCRMCLLVDENGCRTCENVARKTGHNDDYKLKITKQNTNVIIFNQSENTNNHVSVVKTNTQEFHREPAIVETSVSSKEKKLTKKQKNIKNKELKLQKKFKCDECGQEFRRQSHFEWHVRRHTGERPFVCEKCNKSYTQKAKLNRHMKLHSDERPFKCTECNKAFRLKDGLVRHSRTHTHEKPYACKTCPAKFSELSNLNKHLTIHTQEKLFMCSECGARFSLKWNLIVHLRVHSRERPYACAQCHREFNNLKDLNRHSIVHLDEKPFKCEYCGNDKPTYFRRKDNLDRHIKNLHQGVNQKHKTEIKKADTQQNVVKLETKNVIDPKPERKIDVIQQTVITTNSNYIEEKSTNPVTKPEPHKNNTVSVINGPVKLACKTKDFKDHYNIKRQEPEIIDHNVDIYKRILSPMTDRNNSDTELLPIRDPDIIIKTLDKEPPPKEIIKHKMAPISVPRIHYETSFESEQHAIIKNIKFKLPPDYTPTLWKWNAQRGDEEHHSEAKQKIIDNYENTAGHSVTPLDSVTPLVRTTGIFDKQNCVRTITKTPSLTTDHVAQNSNSNEIHWRKRTSQIYNPD